MTGRPQPSAAPLFRAVRGGGWARNDDDFYPTPADATRAVLAVELPRLQALDPAYRPPPPDTEARDQKK